MTPEGQVKAIQIFTEIKEALEARHKGFKNKGDIDFWEVIILKQVTEILNDEKT